MTTEIKKPRHIPCGMPKTDEDLPSWSKAPVYVRMDPQLKMRLVAQCRRLNLSQAGLVKMAMVRFLEEEEQVEANRAYRRT
jgi:hypothetical protein